MTPREDGLGGIGSDMSRVEANADCDRKALGGRGEEAEPAGSCVGEPACSGVASRGDAPAVSRDGGGVPGVFGGGSMGGEALPRESGFAGGVPGVIGWSVVECGAEMPPTETTPGACGIVDVGLARIFLEVGLGDRRRNKRNISPFCDMLRVGHHHTRGRPGAPPRVDKSTRIQ